MARKVPFSSLEALWKCSSGLPSARTTQGLLIPALERPSGGVTNWDMFQHASNLLSPRDTADQ
jgi:hypothetical protein